MKRIFLVLWLALSALAVPVLAQTGSVSVSLTAQSTDCSVAKSCAVLNIGQNVGGAALTLVGTWSGTVQFEGEGADGKTWVAISVTPSNSTTTVTSATGNGTWQVNVSGYKAVRIRCSTFTSGTINASISSSTASARGGSGGGGGGGSSATVAPNQNVIYASPNCGIQTNCYPVVADNSTDNATDFAALSTAANAATRTAVNGQPQALTVELAGGTYLWTTGLSFTKPTRLHCNGSILNYTGSAHAGDFGPAGLVNATMQTGEYTIEGCTFIGGASMTEGPFFNQYLVKVRILNNTFRDFGASASARVYLDGRNWDIRAQGNTWLDDDDTTRGAILFVNNRDANSQLRFLDNNIDCLDGEFASAGCTAPGTGLVSGGTGSQIEGNNFNFFAPNIIIPQLANATRLINNYAESNVASVAVPGVQYGLSGDTGMLDGLLVEGLYVNQHSNNSPIGPGSATMGLSNANIKDLYIINQSTAKTVAQNNVTGQIGNQFSGGTLFTNTNGSNIGFWAGYDSFSGVQIQYTYLLSPQVYTVSTLPMASSVGAGVTAMVSDAMTFTPGTCTGGGSDYMLAVSDGSGWSCH